MKSSLTACGAMVLLWLFQSPAAWAQCSLDIQSNIVSGWSKLGVSYAVDKNILRVTVSEGVKNDTDSIYIGSIKGCSTLTLTVLNISGQYPWGGKAIGLSFANDALEAHQWGNQASFPSPRERAIEDGFIKTSLSSNSKLVYDIDNSNKATYIGAKVFIGSNNALEFELSAQAARDPQLITQQPSRGSQLVSQQTSRERQSGGIHQPVRPSKGYTADTAYQTASPAASCSMNCHAGRAEGRQFAYSRDFSIPPRAMCRDRDD